MFTCGGNPPLDALAEHPDRAVYVDGVSDRATARQLIDRVLAVADLINLPEVHVCAEAEALPLLAAAAAEIKDLPEGFQLHQIVERPVDAAEGGLVWLSRDLLKYPAMVG